MDQTSRGKHWRWLRIKAVKCMGWGVFGLPGSLDPAEVSQVGQGSWRRVGISSGSGSQRYPN